MIEPRLQSEVESFQGLWQGGFYAGDPADPVFGQYGLHSFIGVSHAIFLLCIKPWVKDDTRVLEIGCGRGAWSRLMLNARELHCVDVLSAEHNGFWGYVGKHENVHYYEVSGFSLDMLPPGSIDYCFSYDVLCHVSFEGITRYAEACAEKMAQGAHGFWMVADYDKYNGFIDNIDKLNVARTLLPRRKRGWWSGLLKRVVRAMGTWIARRYALRPLDIAEDDELRPGRWYHAGTDRTCDMLRSKGFVVVDDDMGIDHRSPMIHFRMPG